MNFNLTRTEAYLLAKDRIVLASACATLALLAGTAWFMFGGLGTGDLRKNHYTHMHCSVCKEEIPYSARLVGKPCTACEAHGTYTPTVGSLAEGGGPSGKTAKILVFLVLAILLVECVAYLSIVRLRAVRQAVENARHRRLVCACPFCQRKVGYPATKAGTGVICARCKTAFCLPLLEPMGECI